MATYFSNHYTETGSSQTAVDRRWKAPAGIAHGRLRYKICRCTGLVTNSDHVRFGTFKSSDRIVDMLLSCVGDSDAGDLNIGAHLTGSNNDGAVIDMDVFASQLATAGGLDRTDAMLEATNCVDEDRGLPLWELASKSVGTHTADPLVNIDITGTPTTTFTTTAEALVLEIWYTAGD